jgi:hypothetical protein
MTDHLTPPEQTTPERKLLAAMLDAFAGRLSNLRRDEMEGFESDWLNTHDITGELMGHWPPQIETMLGFTVPAATGPENYGRLD